MSTLIIAICVCLVDLVLKNCVGKLKTLEWYGNIYIIIHFLKNRADFGITVAPHTHARLAYFIRYA